MSRGEREIDRWGLGSGFRGLADGHGARPSLLVGFAALTIARVAAQIVQMPVGNRGQALKLSLAVLTKFALENPPRGRTAQALMGFIDLRQQLDIGARVALRKAMPTAALHPYLACGHIAPH